MTKKRMQSPEQKQERQVIKPEEAQCITDALIKHQNPAALARLFIEVMCGGPNRYTYEEAIEFGAALAGLAKSISRTSSECKL